MSAKRRRVAPLDWPDTHHLSAAEGWLELGNHLEANAELDEISPSLRAHPDVLSLRWHIYAAAEKWDSALEIAGDLVRLVPANARAPAKPHWRSCSLEQDF